MSPVGRWTGVFAIVIAGVADGFGYAHCMDKSESNDPANPGEKIYILDRRTAVARKTTKGAAE